MVLNTLSLVQLVAVAGLCYLIWRRGGCCGVAQQRSGKQGTGDTAPPDGSASEQPIDPLRVLDARLARGEIDAPEYERVRSRLIS